MGEADATRDCERAETLVLICPHRHSIRPSVSYGGPHLYAVFEAFAHPKRTIERPASIEELVKRDCSGSKSARAHCFVSDL